VPHGWFGLTPLVLNPTFTNVQDLDKLAQVSPAWSGRTGPIS
jgi:hypothetical protein